MKPENRRHVAKYMMETSPVGESWTEKRLAFKWGNDVYLITDNYPHWTISQVLDFLSAVGIKPFELEVEVTPKLKD